jgi:hypothetical protein
MNRRGFTRVLALLGLARAGASFSRNVTWSELFSDSPSIDYGQIFQTWRPHIPVPEKIAPIGASALGSIIFMEEKGTVSCLDPIQGKVRQVAASFEAFSSSMNSEVWQIENLHSKVVAEIVSQGHKRAANQSFALAPHPNFTGGISLERSKVMALSTEIWHHISMQSFFKQGDERKREQR